MPYAVDFLVAGEPHSTVVDAPDAAAAVAAVMAAHRGDRFELLRVQPAEASASVGTSPEEVAAGASRDEP